MKTTQTRPCLRALSLANLFGRSGLGGVLALPLLISALSLAGGSAYGNDVTGGKQGAEPLATRTVAAAEVPTGFPLDGVVEAVVQATVAAQVSGRVVEVKADAGQRVRKGQVLMRLDTRESTENLAAARANLTNAQAAYTRTQQLRQQNFVSQSALDKARADLDAAQANVGAAGATDSHGVITAPIQGVVAKRLTELGEMAAPGRALFAVYDPSSLRVTVAIPQYQLARLRQVQKARVEFPELGTSLDSRAVQILPAADAATHTAEVRILLPGGDQPGAPLVLPGMAARVRFDLGSAIKLSVPASAVVRRGEVAAVYVRDESGRFSLRQLRLGEVLGNGEVEVLAGLSSGENLALDPVKAGIALKNAGVRP